MFRFEDLQSLLTIVQSYIATLQCNGFNSGPLLRKPRALQLEHHRSCNTFKFMELKYLLWLLNSEN